MAVEVVELTGDLTMDQPDARDQALDKLPQAKECQVDLSKIGEVDSSAVAVMIGLQRRAQVNDMKLGFINVPVSLRRLITYYGLDELLDLEQAS